MEGCSDALGLHIRLSKKILPQTIDYSEMQLQCTKKVCSANIRGKAFEAFQLVVLVLHLDPEGPCFQTIDDAKLLFN